MSFEHLIAIPARSICMMIQYHRFNKRRKKRNINNIATRFYKKKKCIQLVVSKP